MAVWDVETWVCKCGADRTEDEQISWDENCKAPLYWVSYLMIITFGTRSELCAFFFKILIALRNPWLGIQMKRRRWNLRFEVESQGADLGNEVKLYIHHPCRVHLCTKAFWWVPRVPKTLDIVDLLWWIWIGLSVLEAGRGLMLLCVDEIWVVMFSRGRTELDVAVLW